MWSEAVGPGHRIGGSESDLPGGAVQSPRRAGWTATPSPAPSLPAGLRPATRRGTLQVMQISKTVKMDARQTREALLAAVNAHDTKTIRTFLDPSYVARNESGMVLMDSHSLIDYGAQLFRMHPEYRESLVI